MLWRDPQLTGVEIYGCHGHIQFATATSKWCQKLWLTFCPVDTGRRLKNARWVVVISATRDPENHHKYIAAVAKKMGPHSLFIIVNDHCSIITPIGLVRLTLTDPYKTLSIVWRCLKFGSRDPRQNVSKRRPNVGAGSQSRNRTSIFGFCSYAAIKEVQKLLGRHLTGIASFSAGSAGL